MAKQVFYDPRRSRWKRVLLLSNIVGVLVTLLIIFFVYSAMRGVRLPELLLQEQKHPFHALKEKEKEKEKERRRVAHKRGHRKSKQKKGFGPRSTWTGMPLASPHCVSIPAKSICSFPTGCMSSLPTATFR